MNHVTNVSKAEKHKQTNCKHYDDYFNKKIFYYNVKRTVELNPEKTTQQVYEQERFKQRAESDTVMPDFNEIKSTLSRLRTIKNNNRRATNINDIVVENKLIANNEKFLIQDNQISDCDDESYNENENSIEEIRNIFEKSLTFDDSTLVKCDECGKICKKRGLNVHKAVHRKKL